MDNTHRSCFLDCAEIQNYLESTQNNTFLLANNGENSELQVSTYSSRVPGRASVHVLTEAL